MISSRRMAIVDENAEALGVPRKQLMESSGNAVARAVRDVAEPGASVALVCGRGNNGGDGMVAARFLSAYETTVHLLGRPESIATDIARENWTALERAAVDARPVTDSRSLSLGDPDAIVDAMLGTGVSGDLREPEATAAARINDADAPVVSVDVPSGMDADTGEAPSNAVAADRVVTFHGRKPGLADREEFDVTVADIGIPEAAAYFVGPGDLRALARDEGSHKGDHGDVLVIGGGPFAGAPAFSGLSALRAGADLANVACPASVADAVQGYAPDLIVRKFDGERFAPDHVDALLSLAETKDVVAVGPGLGDADETMEAVRRFLSAFEGTAVVDADALRVVPEVETDATLICTPHQGEFREMGGETSDDWRERAELVERFAADTGHVMLVKSAYDVVSDGETTRVNRAGNPGMTVGGTGDVLTGATAAFAATQAPLDAAGMAAYANGRAGDAAREESGFGLTASDVLDHLPAAVWRER